VTCAGLDLAFGDDAGVVVHLARERVAWPA
jgi:hypothetical protein